MKPRVLALDLDGTIAEHDRIDADVVAAVQDARRAGLLVVLVTGRTLRELDALLPRPASFDAVVAENGAVLRLPTLPAPILLCDTPDPRFLAELESRGIRHQHGLCIVDADAEVAPGVVEIIRKLGLPLAITFNLSRLMVLPHGVSKASGLQEVFWRLRISAHNAIAVGNAENDHDMLALCEIGAAVAWGSDELMRRADEVVPGHGPRAVATYLRDILALPRLPPTRLGRRRVRFGTLATGEPLDFAVRGRNILVGGDPKSGKSWMAGALCEQLILQRYSLCILDPEGDYACLDALPSVIVYPVDHKDTSLLPLERALTHPDLSLVLDMSAAPREHKPFLVRRLLTALNRVRRQTGLPHRVVVDEAHYFLTRFDDTELFDHELGGYLLVTYRISDLSPAILRASEAVVVTRVADERQALALLTLAPGLGTSEGLALLADLGIDEAVLLPGALESEASAKRFHVAPRLAPHVRHRRKYADVPVRPGHEFVFTVGGRPTGNRAGAIRDLLAALPTLPEDVLQGHLRRGDFHRWIEDVFGDLELGAELRSLERAPDGNIREALRQIIADRYGD